MIKRNNCLYRWDVGVGIRYWQAIIAIMSNSPLKEKSSKWFDLWDKKRHLGYAFSYKNDRLGLIILY